MNIKRVNLNLIVHFNALFEEQSVSKAAEKSFISQTAMSQILKKLRELFDDPLFVRKPHGLIPTPKAKMLRNKVTAFLNGAENLFIDDTQDHSQFIKMEAIFANYGEYILLPELCIQLARLHPNMSLGINSVSSYHSLDKLLSEKVDFAIAPGFINTGESIVVERLMHDNVVCVVGKNSDLSQKEITEDIYLSSYHIDVKFVQDSSAALCKIFPDYRDRLVKYTVPSYFAAMLLAEELNSIVTMPNSIAKFLKQKYQIEIKSFPVKSEFYINGLYHSRLGGFEPIRAIFDLIKSFHNIYP